MRIIVCVKPVPDPKQFGKLRFDRETGTLIRENVPGTINPLDKNALEEGIRLKEVHGGEVVAVSMAPPDTSLVIREALAMGADRAVLLSDPLFGGSDTLGTALLLAEGIKSIGGYDLVLCGNETIDSGTAQVSAQIAEFLEIPNLMFVSRIEYSPGECFRIWSETEIGRRIVEVDPPVVLSVVKEINEPRYVTMIKILAAEEKEIMVLNAQDIDPAEKCFGLEGSPTRMAGQFALEHGRQAEMLEGTPEAQAEELANRLHRLGFF
ncbi:MAG: electron transfer flavoprotein subunit beta/FixA family protein [Deltaproteobacteria bacterium]|nr:electron transfer flavoprotein subunit beta/FixA family protein [Deltaproteobacteria bacterium]